MTSSHLMLACHGACYDYPANRRALETSRELVTQTELLFLLKHGQIKCWLADSFSPKSLMLKLALGEISTALLRQEIQVYVLSGRELGLYCTLSEFNFMFGHIINILWRQRGRVV